MERGGNLVGVAQMGCFFNTLAPDLTALPNDDGAAWVLTTWAQILALPLSSSVTSGSVFNSCPPPILYM